MNNDYFEEASRQILGLNSTERKPHIYDASIGARWLMLKITGQDLMQFMRDYMTVNYKFKELDKYFKPDELRQSQYFLRDDFENNYECPNEIEYIVIRFGEYWHAVLDNANGFMFSQLTTDELRKDKEAILTEEPVLKK